MNGELSVQESDIIVAGHLCLDVIPAFSPEKRDLSEILVPGRLTNVGGAVCATGGTVSNTGMAMARYGLRTRLVGKVGDDAFGKVILGVMRERGDDLVDCIAVVPGGHSSYTIVINPPGTDRIFLHCPGVNDTFRADDVDFSKLGKSRLFHFGYPPLMRGMFLDGGIETINLYRNAKQAGLITSLDMARPDPGAESGRVDWRSLLVETLRHVDIFLPSVDELLYMLDRSRFERFEAALARGVPLGGLIRADLRALADELIAMGSKIVVLKLGACGLYLRTSATARQVAGSGWNDQDFYHPCFATEVVGTTGAGDCTIAGFLAALLYGQSPAAAMDSATASGACNVQAADAISGIADWGTLQMRISSGWATAGGFDQST